MIGGPERDADKRKAAFDRNTGDRPQRAIATRDPENVRVGLARETLEVVPRPQHVDVDVPGACLRRELFGGRAVVSRAGIHDQEARHAPRGYRPRGL